MTTFNIDSAVASLNQFQTVFSPDYNKALRQELELESMITPKEFDYKGSYTEKNMASTELLQTSQKGFIQKGTTTVSGIVMTQRAGMVNVSWDWSDLQEMHKDFLQESRFAQENTDPLNWNFPKFFYEQVMKPKLIEELNICSFQGSYVAPANATTANAAIAVFDGILTQIAAGITASVITPITTAAWTTTNVLAQLKVFMDVVPFLEKQMGGEIWCSPNLYQWAYDRYLVDYGANLVIANSLGTNFELKIPSYPKVTLKPLLGMGNTSRIIYAPKGFTPFNWAYDNSFGGPYPAGRWIKDDMTETVAYRMRMSRGYQLRFATRTFVNDKTAAI